MRANWPPAIHSFRSPANALFSGGGGYGCSAKDCATGNRTSACPLIHGRWARHWRICGRHGAGGASNLELLLWRPLLAIVGDVVMVLWIGFIVALIAALAQGAFATIGALALAATGTLVVRVLLALLLRHGPARLDYLFALSVFSAQRSPRAGILARIIAGFLRGWGIFATLAGLLGMVAGLGYSIWLLFGARYHPAGDGARLGRPVGSLIVRAIGCPRWRGGGGGCAGAAALADLGAPLHW